MVVANILDAADVDGDDAGGDATHSMRRFESTRKLADDGALRIAQNPVPGVFLPEGERAADR